MSAVVDWPVLRLAATEVAQRAYAPYSGVRVGAAALLDDGRVVAGCNVENASYGLGLCAECSLVSGAVSGADGGSVRLLALAVVAADGDPLAPCGRCRQVLFEFGGADLLIDGFGTLGDLLPQAFGPGDVELRRG